MRSDNAKVRVQSFGRFLSNMVMPNIGAFIAWGFITALFIPTGWIPNETLASMVGPMITYLLPLLIGYTGGRMVAGERGAVVGATTTMGVIVGADVPMFMGAMIAGPLGGWAIKKFDEAVDGKVKSGFEMLVNNFSAGIVGMLCAILAYMMIGPVVETASDALAAGVNFLVEASLLPLTSLFVEPAKILFLNNAINHGIFSPLGIQQASEVGRSIFFLVEANPGPGMGVLLAYMMFGKGSASKSAAGASIIHFFGGIHEIYFPYVLMNPRLILAVIAGGMTGVFTLTLFDAGMVAPASPGSIIAVLMMTPKASIIGVVASILASTGVSFFVASLLMKTKGGEDEEESLEEASARMQGMKSQSKGQTAAAAVDMSSVTNILVACDAGMGSSAMGASLLRKKVEKAGLAVTVKNCAINSLPENAEVVLTHKDLTSRARKSAPNAHHMSLSNFLDSAFYDNLISDLKEAKSGEEAVAVASEEPAETAQPKGAFQLSASNIHLGLKASNKEEAIRFAGQQLVDSGYVEPEYIDAMLEREKLVPTYLGESIAVPHGTEAAKDRVLKTGIAICQYPEGIHFGEEEDDIARLVIAIAARNNEHVQVISAITNTLDDPDNIERLTTTGSVKDVLELLGQNQAA